MSKYWQALVVTSLCCSSIDAEPFQQLDTSKSRFIESVLNPEMIDGPLCMSYELSTVFLSSDLVSLFGTYLEYTCLPHHNIRYEGINYYKLHGQFVRIALRDIFVTDKQWEFLRVYCERDLRKQGLSYFCSEPPLRLQLDSKLIYTFVFDHESLIIVFQPYGVGGLADGPFTVRIPFSVLELQCEHPLFGLMKTVMTSQSWVSAWDSENPRYSSLPEHRIIGAKIETDE
jgi:hypothetical protein